MSLKQIPISKLPKLKMMVEDKLFTESEMKLLLLLGKGNNANRMEFEQFRQTFKNDPLVATIALLANNSNAKWISPILMKDPHFAYDVLSKNPQLIFDFGSDIKNNVDLAYSIFEQGDTSFDYDLIQYWGYKVISDKDTAELCVERSKYANAYPKYSSELRADEELTRKAVRKNSYNLEFASQELRANKRMVKLAGKRSVMAAIISMDEKLLLDPEILAYLFERNSLWLAVDIQFRIEDGDDPERGMLMKRAVEKLLMSKPLSYFLKALQRIDMEPKPLRTGPDQNDRDRIIRPSSKPQLAIEWISKGLIMNSTPEQMKEIISKLNNHFLKEAIQQNLSNHTIGEIGFKKANKSAKRRVIGVHP